MARNLSQELKDVQTAIDNAQQNGGVTSIDFGDVKVGIALATLHRRERELETKIRLKHGAGRNAGTWG